MPAYNVNWGTLWCDGGYEEPDQVVGDFATVKAFTLSGLTDLINRLDYVREKLQTVTKFDDLDELESWQDLIEIRKLGRSYAVHEKTEDEISQLPDDLGDEEA
jgi:hypothetical protein